jgi:carbonic anhydrase
VAGEHAAITSVDRRSPNGKEAMSSQTSNVPGSRAGVERALKRNRAFAAAGGHQAATVFPALGLFVVTCLDPRSDPAHFLGIGLGDAMVVRNLGGLVTTDVVDAVAFVGQLAGTMVPDGPLFEVAVIHHTDCKASALADDAFRHDYAKRVGTDESTLRERAIVEPYETVVRDVERLRLAPAISSRISVSGHVYNLETGLVETVVSARPAETQSAA